jgi:hypothetical protein
VTVAADPSSGLRAATALATATLASPTTLSTLSTFSG